MDNPRETTRLDSVLGAIGNTPLIELSRITRGVKGRILAKLEYLNPGFSKKDRIALQMIEEAEAAGTLQPGQTVVELTSGNTGTGLSIVCSVKGYPFVAVMSKGNSIERARMMKALGAEVVLVDQLPDSTPGQVSGGDLELVEREAQRIVQRAPGVSSGSVPPRGQCARSLSAHRTGDYSPVRRQRGRLLRFCRHGRFLCRLRRRPEGV